MKKFFNIFEWTVLGIVGIFAIFLLVLSLFGYDYYSVVSPSMGNEIPMGSFVCANSVDENDAKEIITTRMNNGDVFSIVCQNEQMNIPLLHQVIECDETTVTIHGIANDEGVNETFSYGDVKGIVSFSIPFLGYLTQWINSLYFWIIAVLIVIMYFIIKMLLMTISTKSKS